MELQNKKNSWLTKSFKLTLVLLIFLTLAYLALGFVFDRQFFARDASEKYGRVLGDTTLSVRIIGPPGKPTLSASPLCNYAGAPFVRLTWEATSDTDSYDLNRDGNPLVNGLVATTYDDYAVSPATDYSYVATAIGPAGQTDSDPVVVTTNLCDALPDPIIIIDEINADPITNPLAILQIYDVTPTFRGHTNINNALIEIELHSAMPIFATTNANAGGFWEWTAPVDLELGMHLLTATAIDPLDSARRESASIEFEILPVAISSSSDDDDQSNTRKKKKTASRPAFVPAIQWPEIWSSFTLSLDVLNENDIVYSGQTLKTKLTAQVKDASFKQKQTIDYFIFDSEGALVGQTSTEFTIFQTALLYKDLAIPRLLQNGKYQVVAQTHANGVLVSAQSFFTLQEAPLVTAGPVKITLTQLTQNLSWAIAILSLLLLLLLILLSIEYWLYKHSRIHITEDLLEREGFFGKRKGVLR